MTTDAIKLLIFTVLMWCVSARPDDNLNESYVKSVKEDVQKLSENFED